MSWSNSMTLQRYRRRFPTPPRWFIWAYAALIVVMSMDMQFWPGSRTDWIVTRSLQINEAFGTVGGIVVVYGFLLLGVWIIWSKVDSLAQD